jgi:metallo-beta-lactamase class B
VNRRDFLARSALAVPLFAVAGAARLRADQNPDWTRPFPPFKIAGSLYYVGSADLASYLIVTPAGLVLINSDLISSPPLIRRSIEQLGFHFRDIRILLISHAHSDHCGGSAEILKLTGAKYYVMAGDARVVESGGRADFQYGREPDQLYPPAHVDRILHDGDTVSLGGTVLTAHLTAGHTRGTTTWTLDEKEFGPSGSPGAEGTRTLHAVIVGSPNVNPGYKLVGNTAYPQIAADYARGFAVLQSLPCDIFLGAHGSYFDLKDKYARWKAGDGNAFLDSAGYKAYIAERRHAFEAELARQSHAR